MICARLLLRVRRVSSRTRLRNRARDCGAMRRRGCSPFVKAKTQEFALARSGDRALRLVDLQLEALGQEPFDARHHSLAAPLTANLDVAIIGIDHEVLAARPPL